MTNKTWLITGTSSGFGQALAQLVAQNKQFNLVATARKMSDLAYLDQYDEKRILKIIVDVTNQQQIEQAVKAAQSKFKQIDILVNNAGLGYFGTIEESKDEDIKQLFAVNVFGLAKMTQAVLPVMRAQKSGLIINISSVLGLTSLPTLGWYSASKYAVEGYSNALRQEVADLGIKVMLVEPSGARTKWNAGKTAPVTILDYAKFSEMVKGAVTGETNAPGNPEKVAQAIYDLVMGTQTLPNHLPLGEFATNGIQQELSTTLKEVEQYHQLSLTIDTPNQEG